jgi:glyoxylase-like metal-dependent hydrolase (beta-lactamase superfamily II)
MSFSVEGAQPGLFRPDALIMHPERSIRPPEKPDQPPADPAPSPGAIHEEVPGVWRIPVPLAFRPREVNAYLIEVDPGGWILVDGGPDVADAWDAVATAVERLAAWSALRLHVITHMHLDHVGLARRVRHASSVPLAMGALDAERSAHAARDPGEEDAYRGELLRSNGAPHAVSVAAAEAALGGRALAPHVPADRLLPGSPEPLRLEGGWSALWTPGHTAGHCSLFREADRTLVAGDAVLPGISPTLGVNRQREDPVGDYLRTLDRLEALEPATVLPGHGSALAGTARIRELRRETLAEASRVLDLVADEPLSAWEIATLRYRHRDLPISARLQALRETLAHLDRLARRGALRLEVDAAGVRRYNRI